MMPDRLAVRELLRQIGMKISEKQIVPVHGGTVNLAFRVDQGGDAPLVVRIAPSDDEAAAGPSWLTSHGLRREQTTIRLLSEDIAALMPRTVHFDDTRTLIDRDWVVQTWVRGDAWAELGAQLSQDESLRLWRELGRLTRGIHTSVSETFGPPEAGLGFTTWSDLVRWDVTGLLVDADRFGLDTTPFQRLERIVDRAVPILNRIREARLIHSDL
ncbi:MAG TPA: phosphotransferase, partial [Thermomicrobiales bacterium]|nr:phosphotransferase [Thermomicrobiales bacterium]